MQKASFNEEYSQLSKGIAIERESKIVKLRPQLHKGVMVAKGRFSGDQRTGAIIPFEERYPIILAKKRTHIRPDNIVYACCPHARWSRNNPQNLTDTLLADRWEGADKKSNQTMYQHRL